jgi:ATP-dependent RNA helicase DBP3
MGAGRTLSAKRKWSARKWSAGGNAGVAYTFFCGQNDKPRAGELINVLREAGQPIPESLLHFGTTVKKKESQLYGAHFKDLDPSKTASKITFDSDDE